MAVLIRPWLSANITYYPAVNVCYGSGKYSHVALHSAIRRFTLPDSIVENARRCGSRRIALSAARPSISPKNHLRLAWNQRLEAVNGA